MRIVALALAGWYLLVASSAVHFAVDEWLPWQPDAGSCIAQSCCCGSRETCRMRCCCPSLGAAAGRPSVNARAAAAVPRISLPISLMEALDCSGDAPATSHALPMLSPAVVPQHEVVLPSSPAPERFVEPPRAAPRTSARAPEKVPIEARNG